MAVGAPGAFLPGLVDRIESADSEAERILFLHALKEVSSRTWSRATADDQVILHSSPVQLESLADHSWSPLFAQDPTSAESDIGEDSVRNVKAACIGKLTTTAPQKFLPELQNLLTSSVRDRALVAAAVRYTFIDTSSSFDELIAPIIIDFLSLVSDENVVSRCPHR
jgi:cullin-associated NEDD8-dissociated protein 1